jgi:gluconate 2-dehydrogenase gamma chain
MNPEEPAHRDSAHPDEFMSRRAFLCGASATLLAAPLLGWPSSRGGSFRILTDSEAATLNALCERIIPADQDPGASWAGVVEFIDRKLAGYHRRYRSLYRAGLRGVGESSRALFGRGFVDLDGRQQDELLRRLETDQAPGPAWEGARASEFFDRLVDHTMQGFYGGPRHGGNRDAVSWHMLGLPTPPLRSRRPLSAAWNKAAATPPHGP